jgi:hypothetical protein
MTDGEEKQEVRGGLLQEVGPYTGENVNRGLKVRPVQEVRERPVQEVGLVQEWRGEACTGGGVKPVQEVVRKARCPFGLK